MSRIRPADRRRVQNSGHHLWSGSIRTAASGRWKSPSHAWPASCQWKSPNEEKRVKESLDYIANKKQLHEIQQHHQTWESTKGIRKYQEIASLVVYDQIANQQLSYFSRSQFHPQLILWSPQFICQLSMCHVPSSNKVVGHYVYHRSVIVVVSVGERTQQFNISWKNTVEK